MKPAITFRFNSSSIVLLKLIPARTIASKVHRNKKVYSRKHAQRAMAE